MRAIPLALLAALLSCTPSSDAGRRDAVPVRTAPPAPPRVQGAEPAALPSPDAWIMRADSVMGESLERDLFLSPAGRPAGVQDCADDEGSDDPPLQAAAVTARVVSRAPAVADSMMEPGNVVMRSTYRVAVTSVATMVPHWMARFAVDSGPADESTYEGRIATRVDTFEIKVAELIRRRGDEPELEPVARGPHWMICEPGLPAGEAPSLWSFAHDQPRWMHVRKWTPADGSWERVVALADSARKAKE